MVFTLTTFTKSVIKSQIWLISVAPYKPSIQIWIFRQNAKRIQKKGAKNPKELNAYV